MTSPAAAAAYALGFASAVESPARAEAATFGDVVSLCRNLEINIGNKYGANATLPTPLKDLDGSNITEVGTHGRFTPRTTCA